MSLVAITRSPGPELAWCELTHLERVPIDFDLALAQHQAYKDALRDAWLQVIELPSDPSLPDGTFVEDTAVVLNELAIISSPRPASRRNEWPAVAAALRPFRSLSRISAGAFLEGGDVVRIGRKLYVGQAGRTDVAGLTTLAEIGRPYGYEVVPVRLEGCLHLKSACCALDRETILINRRWLEAGPLSSLRMVDVPAEEPSGANVLGLPETILVSAACPRTADLLSGLGYRVVSLDVSEIHKAEAGLTCMSLVFQPGSENVPLDSQ